ncbi:MAG: tRNA guanosine(34) transglycosylase Tgt, partial [Pseudomonadota bacterium]
MARRRISNRPAPAVWDGEVPDYSAFSFETRTPHNTDDTGRARRGTLSTPHGRIETPAFIFCGTRAAVKGATPAQMRAAKTQIILSNTYHLMLQPGAETVALMGGLHRFMGWNGPMLTDSGGFQVFSLGHGGVADEIKGRKGGGAETKATDQTGSGVSDLVKISEEGVKFRSYIDGSRHMLTPERSIDIQRKLGADLILVLDECTPFHVDKSYTARSMQLSHRWGDRSLSEFLEGDEQVGAPAIGSAGPQALYGIIQGGVYPDLRAESAAYVESRPFFGTAVGGSLGADPA